MIDLRYHVYSLAAVFFALAIGIVVGSSFVGNPADKEQLLRVSDRYERDLVALRTEMRNQQDTLRIVRRDFGRSERMCAAMTPAALKNRLMGWNVAIIQTGDYDELTSKLKPVLESVGARVTSVTKVPTTFQADDPATVAAALTSANIPARASGSGRQWLLETIADGIALSGYSGKLRTLERKNVVSLSGEYSYSNNHILIVGGGLEASADRVKLIDVPIISRLKELGVIVVGCEPTNAESPYVPVWSEAGIATVDNADRAYGQVALICALAGENNRFGQKRGAKLLIPQTLELSQ